MRRTRITRRLCPAAGPDRKRYAAAPGAARGIAAALLLAGAIGGCAAESELLRADPGFTAASLREGGLVVLGVVQVDEVAQVRGPLIAGLERVMRATRADVPLVPASRVEAALPDSAYRLFLLGYQMRGDPDSIWLAAATRAARPMARYGVLARVERDAVRYGTRYVDQGVPGRPSAGEIPVTGRDARIAVDVYDLTTRQIVFRGRFIGSSDEALNLAPPKEEGADSVGIPRGPVLTPSPSRGPAGEPVTAGPLATAYPEAPPVSKAAEAAFVNFARALPGGAPAPVKDGKR